MDYFEELAIFGMNADGSTTYTRFPSRGEPIVTNTPPSATNLKTTYISKASCPAKSRCLVKLGSSIAEIHILEWSPSGNYVKYAYQGKPFAWTNKLPELIEVLTVLPTV